MTQKVPQALIEITGPLPTGNELLGRVIVEEMPAAGMTPTVYNVTCTVADTQYSQTLPENCRMIELQARTEAILRFAFEGGKVATPTAPYMTLKAGDYYYSLVDAAARTIYVASPTATTVAEIIAWA